MIDQYALILAMPSKVVLIYPFILSEVPVILILNVISCKLSCDLANNPFCIYACTYYLYSISLYYVYK